MASDFKTAQPLEFYKQFLIENIRPDGRGLMEFRKTLLNVDSINTANGSALVRLGHTMVVCGIKAELSEPSPEEIDKGFIVPNVELPPLCSPEFRPGPPSEKAQVLSQFVADTIKNCGLITLEDLCIEPKKLCWVLYADIICLSHDGNLIDAVLTALYTALKHTKLPVVAINEETGLVERKDESFKLKLSNTPVSTTIAIFDDSLLLVDPTHEEEELSSGTITIVIGKYEQLCSVYKPGGYPISEESLKKCIQAALDRSEEIDNLLYAIEESVER